MHRYSTKVEWSEPDGAFIATCPEFPGVSAFGEDLETAVRELQTAVDLALETYEAEGWDPPQPEFMKRYSGQFRLRLPESMHRELVRLADHEGVSLNTISVRLLEHGLSCRAKVLRNPGETAQ